jgi:hypothetical protein
MGAAPITTERDVSEYMLAHYNHRTQAPLSMVGALWFEDGRELVWDRDVAQWVANGRQVLWPTTWPQDRMDDAQPPYRRSDDDDDDALAPLASASTLCEGDRADDSGALDNLGWAPFWFWREIRYGG